METPSRFRDPRRNVTADRHLERFRRLYRLPSPRAEHIARFRDTLFDGDPLADALARTVPRAQQYALVVEALDRGIGAVANPPPALVALFAELDVRPAWLDEDKLVLAARTASRAGLSGAQVLSCICLTGGYRSSAANKPIALTGALTSMASRRLAETSQFVVELYDSEGLSRRSAGFRAAVMVRLMHTTVRARLTHDPRWRASDWGLPINQADLLSTNLLFSTVFVIGLRMLGHVITRREADALVHFWRYVGVLMGIRDELLPRDFAEACALVYVAGATQPPGDEDSRALAAALLDVPPAPGLPRWLVTLDRKWRAGFSRLMLGDDAADDLGLEDTPLKWLVLVSAGVNLATEGVRLLLPGGERLVRALRRARVHRSVERSLGGEPARFRVAE